LRRGRRIKGERRAREKDGAATSGDFNLTSNRGRSGSSRSNSRLKSFIQVNFIQKHSLIPRRRRRNRRVKWKIIINFQMSAAINSQPAKSGVELTRAGDGEEESEEGEENRSEARRRTDPVFYPYSWNDPPTGSPYQRTTAGDVRAILKLGDPLAH